MNGAGPQALEMLQVGLGMVALVSGKTVPWISQVLLFHHPVPCDLGDDGGGRDGEATLVSLDYGLEGHSAPRQGKSAMGFVAGFVFVAVGMLIAYHYAEETAANRKYLEWTTRHTAFLLGHLGEKADVRTGEGWPRCSFLLR